ncbi:MAG: CDP-diacylglycerol--glycerol-3-phosphate 3-phosphatidyltransferase [Planctomycetia bacterium]|nr:CDP-diacylglycerol--glycerol-3-phosphate 3-phosphatidyltransferase [Planctomycetia bacterium]
MSAGSKKRAKAAKAAQAVKQAARDELRKVVFNLPNQLTWLRLVLTIVMFVLIGYGWYGPAMGLFIVAASTDWLDGYFARKYKMVTTLGRILDPFADKVIICGTFIYLAALPGLSDYLRPWMAVLVVARELLVTALRSFLEQKGADFSASFAGKLKMIFQCIAAGVGLFAMWRYAEGGKLEMPTWVQVTLVAAIWAAVVTTVYSGIGYIISAVRLLRR